MCFNLAPRYICFPSLVVPNGRGSYLVSCLSGGRDAPRRSQGRSGSRVPRPGSKPRFQRARSAGAAGRRSGRRPQSELVLLEDQVLPPGELPLMECVPPQVAVGDKHILLLHEDRSPGVRTGAVTRGDRDGGARDMCHETAGRGQKFGS